MATSRFSFVSCARDLTHPAGAKLSDHHTDRCESLAERHCGMHDYTGTTEKCRARVWRPAQPFCT
jgi:hypothetical protein